MIVTLYLINNLIPMKKQLITLFTAFATFLSATMPTATLALEDVSLHTGDLITSDQTKAVYYFAPDGRRYVFPNEKTYFTWYPDFSEVRTISHVRLQALPLGRSNVTYRPGVKMIKITTDPRTYVVERGGILRHLVSEEIAKTLYGLNWNDVIEDVPDPFFTNYRVGTPVDQASQYDPAGQMTITTTISQDKSFDETIATVTIGTVEQGFVPKSITVKKGTRITWVNRDIADHTVKGATFDSGILIGDQQYNQTFNTVGSYDYNCGIHTSMQATINVVP